ncbi:hypothetical protein A9Q84_09490 [Halobacteriovorax marinus]|uniref:Outer membrane protein beta-barrel domain-containing protein n=1 Tax=Halobacteriovorax marinus TaxID=97084 RepID=A0A1Y5FD78_9BACT|nr:hypothetical protein A9Q84_09490 [Halobacteriovorax marinus]
MVRFGLIYFILMTATFAQNAKGVFSIVVEGNRSELSYIKKRSELTMARSTKFCRGSKMPKSQGGWSCKKTKPRISSCVLEYKCKFINKKFNRITETRRLRASLKDLPKSRGKYKITLISKDKKEVVKQLGGAAFFAAAAKKSKTAKGSFSSQKLAASSKRYPNLKKKTPRKKSIKPKTRARVARKEAMEIDEDELEELASLREDETQLKETDPNGDEEWVIEKVKKRNGKEEYQVYKKDEKYKGLSKTKRGKRNDWLSFALSYVAVSDSFKNSLSTFDVSWTPQKWFNADWGMRGNLGVHQFKSSETATLASQTFLVYDIGVFGLYRFGNLFVELGFGLQKWNDTLGESYNTLTFGGGYFFEYYKLGFIDRIQASYTTVGNDAANKEMKLSIGASF